MIYESYADVYSGIRKELAENGDVVPSRIGETKEILACKFTLTNPRARLGYHPDRGFNLPFAIAETVFDVTGINNVDYLAAFNNKVRDYSDNGYFFHGAYGPRVGPNLPQLIEELKNENSRRAVVSIYNTHDLFVNTKDVPCTLTLQFLIRENKLHMIVSMRSNDFFWGLQYDLFRFTMLQEVLANELEIDVGNYYHISGSMHVYEWHYELLDNVKSMENVEMPPNDLVISDYMNMVGPPYSGTLSLTGIPAILYKKQASLPKEELPYWSQKFFKK